MATQNVFKRTELKYILTKAQKETILAAMAERMEPDCFGRSEVRNLYYDTGTFRLARRSIEKPVYKEKLRLRSYGQANAESMAFVELKKKYKGIVYKRRVPVSARKALQWLSGETKSVKRSQIADEIEAFLSYYGTLRPVCFLSYDREAWAAKDGGGFRVTFDENILARTEELTLERGVWGTPLLPEGAVLMELKCPGAIPLWMVRVLSEEKIYKTSFSKYGTAYRLLLSQTEKEGVKYA